MEREEKIIFVFVLLFVFIGTVGFTYGYFRAEFSYQSDELKVTTGTLKLDYVDESPLIYKESFKPGDVITKTFTVENTGTLDATYDLIWKEYKNEITNNELVIKGICDSMTTNNIMSGTCNGINETPVTASNIKSNVSIAPGIKHKYTIEISFKNLNEEQNYNQGKSFTGIINVKDSNQL